MKVIFRGDLFSCVTTIVDLGYQSIVSDFMSVWFCNNYRNVKEENVYRRVGMF